MPFPARTTFRLTGQVIGRLSSSQNRSTSQSGSSCSRHSQETIMAGQAINPASMPALFRRQFELCNVKKGETVILLTDYNTRRDYVQASFAAASDLGAHAYEIG